MPDLRRIAAATLTALALAGAAAGCGGDDEADDGGGGQSDAPVNTETPQAEPGETPAPSEGGQGAEGE